MKTLIADKLTSFWWSRLPLIANQFSKSFAASLFDGAYITSWSGISAFVPPVVLALGFVIGWQHFFPGITFTFSIPIMMLLLVISSFGAGIGFWLWLGYALGDFWLFPHLRYDRWIHTFIYIEIPLLISYALLAGLLVSAPLLCTSVRRQTIPFSERIGFFRVVAGAALQAFLASVFVYIWVWSMPVLIRPLYTWHGQLPPVQAMYPLQQQGQNLVTAAAIAGAARVFLEGFALLSKSEIYTATLQSLRTSPSNWSLPPLIGLPLQAAVTTVVLSGMLWGQDEAIIFGTILSLVLFLREGLLIPLGLWRGWISRVPILLRLIVATCINYFMSVKIIESAWINNPGDTFRPIATAVVMGVIVFSILIPNPRTNQSKGATAPKEA